MKPPCGRILIFFGILFALASPAVNGEIGDIDVNVPAAETAPAAAPKDRSELWIYAGTRATVLVTDERGRRTGLDPATQKVLHEIPRSSCEVDFIPNDLTGATRDEADERIDILQPAKGVYRIAAMGLQAGPYEVSVTAQSRDGSSEPSIRDEGLISAGQTKPMRLTFDPAPHITPTLIPETH